MLLKIKIYGKVFLLLLLTFIFVLVSTRNSYCEEKENVEGLTLEIMLASLKEVKGEAKRNLIRRIALFKDKEAIPEMTFILLDETEEFDTRREGAKAVMALGGEVKYSALLKLLTGDPFTCQKMLRTLMEIGSPEFVTPFIRYSAIDAVNSSCRNMAVADYLKLSGEEKIDFDFEKLKDTKGEWSLIKVAGNNDNKYQAKAIELLGRIKSERSLNVLLKTLKSKRISIQKESLAALEKIESKEAINPVSSLLDQTLSVEVKQSCIKTLIAVKRRAATKAIMKSYESGSFQHKVIILEALSEIQDKRAIRLKRHLLLKENKENREKLGLAVKNNIL